MSYLDDLHACATHLAGLVVLHETIHDLDTKNLDEVIFILDFEKAYNKVKWSFLQKAWCMEDFDPNWRQRVETLL